MFQKWWDGKRTHNGGCWTVASACPSLTFSRRTGVVSSPELPIGSHGNVRRNRIKFPIPGGEENCSEHFELRQTVATVKCAITKQGTDKCIAPDVIWLDWRDTMWKLTDEQLCWLISEFFCSEILDSMASVSGFREPSGRWSIDQCALFLHVRQVDRRFRSRRCSGRCLLTSCLLKPTVEGILFVALLAWRASGKLTGVSDVLDLWHWRNTDVIES